jgi:hypothetical protein
LPLTNPTDNTNMNADPVTPEPTERETSGCLTVLSPPDENGERHEVRFILMTPESYAAMRHLQVERPPVPGDTGTLMTLTLAPERTAPGV